MTNSIIDPQLSASLDAWRQSSRRAPRRHARERAYDAMLEAIAVAARPRAHSFFGIRPRFGRAGLIASTATIIAAASVAAAGWNAPPGSALFLVRQARQGVMLKLPGSDDVVLHLEFAEQSLADARERINPVHSLDDAGQELAAAYSELLTSQASPLWARYRLDAATLVSEESEFETKTPAPAPTSASPEPTDDDHTPAGTNPAPGGGDGEETQSPTTAHASPSPSGDGGDDDGSGGDGSGPSHSPGQSPSPDE